MTRSQPTNVELARELRARRIMVNGGNGNVYDVADDICEKAAARIDELEGALRQLLDNKTMTYGVRVQIARAALNGEAGKP